ELTSVVFHESTDNIESVVATFAREPGGGLIVMPTAINTNHRERIFSLATAHRLPALYPFRHLATQGGLMSYAFDSSDLFRRGASYIDRILKGEKPSDLPVQATPKYAARAIREAHEIGSKPTRFLSNVQSGFRP